MGEKRRTVSFNLENELERSMYKFTKSINFSQFVKKYLEMEMQQSKSSITVSIGE